MTSDELAAAGSVLYGDRWQTALALDLRIADRTMRRWLAGETPIPAGVEPELRNILIERVKAIGELIEYVVSPSDRSVLHYPTNAFFRYDEAGNLILIHPGSAAWEDVPSLTEGAKEAVRSPKSVKEAAFKTAFLLRIDAIDITVRTSNILKSGNIIYVGDLVQKTEAEVLRIPNAGRKMLSEIKEGLASIGLYLGMTVPNWPPSNIERLVEEYSCSPMFDEDVRKVAQALRTLVARPNNLTT